MAASLLCRRCGAALTGADNSAAVSTSCPNCGLATADYLPPGDPAATAALSTVDYAGTLGPVVDSPIPPGKPAPGRIGRFELRATLGQGAFGRVYRAYDPQLDRQVALKVPRFAPDRPDLVDRFLGEARAAARLRHPNIVAVFESGQADGEFYIACEFVEGTSLSTRLARQRPDFNQAARWVRQLALAVAYAHAEGIVHRDIKPANILLDREGRPLLADFGLAKRLGEEAQRTADGTVLGTPAYMAPEQARGDLASVGPLSDQYSLGVVLYELLTGQRPFGGSPHEVLAQVTREEPPPPRRLNPRVPLDLEAICLQAMAKESGRRYASAALLADDLGRFLAGEPIRARRPGARERAARWLWRRRQTFLQVGAVAVAILFTLAAVGWYGAFRPRPDGQPTADIQDAQAEEQQKSFASSQNLRTLGLALLAAESANGRLPPHALCGKDGRPLLSWRVALLPYLDQRTLYGRFRLDESWDSPHNRELLPLMPKVFAVAGVPTPTPYATFYQVFVGPGAMFEADPQRPIRLDDIRDDRSQTILVAEAGEAVEWTRPADLSLDPGKPLPRLGGVVADGFQAYFCDNTVQALKKEIYADDRALRGLIGRQDGELVNLAPYDMGVRRQQIPSPGKAPTGDAARGTEKEKQERVAAAVAVGRKNLSKNNLRQLSLALSNYNARYNSLPPPALSSKEGKPLLSWRVAVLPFLGQETLYRRFKLDEPWDGPQNKELLQYMPKVFVIPDAPVPGPYMTYYQVFVGPGAYEAGTKRRALPLSIPDGTPNTIAVAEAAEAVPWTAPDDIPFAPGGPLPRVGGAFPDGFTVAMFDGSTAFFKKTIYSDEEALRALIGWNDGEVVDLHLYEEEPYLPQDSPAWPTVVAAHRVRSINSLKQLAISMHNYHATFAVFPSYAIHSPDGKPLLSWRVALLPFLEQAPLHRKFKLDEPWDSPHNKALLPLMPKVYESRGVPTKDRGETFYQVFVGPGAAFERDPRRKVRLTSITDGAANTLLIVEAGAAVPWTKPDDLFFETDRPLPKLGGVFGDGFHACMFDASAHFISNKIYSDEKVLRALIGIADGGQVDLQKFR
jgi:hypothetical protein